MRVLQAVLLAGVLTGAPGVLQAETGRAALERTMEQAISSFRARDYEDASIHFRRIYEQVPDADAARAGFALSEMKLGRLRAALDVTLDGLARSPDAALLHEILGDIRYEQNQMEPALKAWQRAQQLAPRKQLLGKIQGGRRLQEASAGHRTMLNSHIALQHAAGVDSGLLGETVEALEESFTHVTRKLDHVPPQPVTVVMHSNRNFHHVTGTDDGVIGFFDGKVHVPLGDGVGLNELGRKTLTHEMVHAIIHSKTKGAAPRWLHEGLALHLEGYELSEAALQDAAFRMKSGPPEAWEARGFSYAVSLILVRHLDSAAGFDALVQLQERLGRNESMDRALFRSAGLTYAELCRAAAAGIVTH